MRKPFFPNFVSVEVQNFSLLALPSFLQVWWCTYLVIKKVLQFAIEIKIKFVEYLSFAVPVESEVGHFPYINAPPQ